MRRSMHIAAALAALLWSSAPAWAVVANSQVTITSGGTPVQGATVTFSTPQSPPTAIPPSRPPRTPTAARPTSPAGGTTVRYETRDDFRSTVAVTVVDGEGRTYTGITTLGDIASGAPINVTPASGAPTGPIIGLGLGGQTTGCDNWQTTEIVSVVADPTGDNASACFSSALRGSVYLGYAHRVGSNWLVGIEADMGFTNSSKTIAGIPGTVNGMPNVTPAVAANDSVKVEKDWDFSLRGRFGYFVTPRTVVYATGGIAFQRMEATLNCTALGACGINGLPVFSSTQSKTLTGWTLGGGVEVSLTDRIVGRVEYRYADYGAYTATFRGPTTTAFTADIDMRTHTALVGIGLKLGGGN